MVNSLFVNTAILVTFLYFSSQLFTNRAIGSKSGMLTIVSIGVLFGLAGCLLMFNGLHFSNNILIDFRAFSLMFSTIFCGPLAGSISALIMIAFRASYFGARAGTILTIITFTLLLMFFSLIRKSKLRFLWKYTYMIAAHITSSLIIIKILLQSTDFVLQLSYQYLAATSTVGVVLYFVLTYIFKTNELYLRLKDESTRDSLTGLYNVRAFDQFVNKSTANAVEKKQALSLLMIDIDFFKKINDTYGHTSGDIVLKQLSKIVTASCRSHDFVSRNGGEEFTVILVNCDDLAAFYIAERIRKNVEDAEFILSKNETVKITVSIGVSCYPSTTSAPGDLLPAADGALYHAKRSGRNAIKSAPLVRSGDTAVSPESG